VLDSRRSVQGHMEEPMRLRVTLLALFVVCLSALSASPALAKTVPIASHSQAAVKKACGGVFWPAGGTTATYGCLNSNGTGIVCGGRTPAQKKTCSTMRLAPKNSPYLADIRAAVARG
jgi:hypothetical protein